MVERYLKQSGLEIISVNCYSIYYMAPGSVMELQGDITMTEL